MSRTPFFLTWKGRKKRGQITWTFLFGQNVIWTRISCSFDFCLWEFSLIWYLSTKTLICLARVWSSDSEQIDHDVRQGGQEEWTQIGSLKLKLGTEESTQLYLYSRSSDIEMNTLWLEKSDKANFIHSTRQNSTKKIGFNPTLAPFLPPQKQHKTGFLEGKF